MIVNSNISDVAIGMDKPDLEKLIVNLAHHPRLGNSLTRDFFVRMYKNYAVISWKQVDWNIDYEEVYFVINFLEEMASAGKPVAFVRVGQNINDNEKWYSNNGAEILRNCFNLKRCIQFEPLN